jgi:isocitrate/isopropylmalate dehydrogenase
VSPHKRVAVIPGDDAAPEAVHATLGVLRTMSLPLEWDVVPDGPALAELASAEREQLVRDAVDRCDTALFGATSGTTGGVWYLRWGKDTFANVRPIRWRRGVPSPLRDPDGIDYVIVRENLEDLYSGIEGDLDELRASTLAPPRHRPGATGPGRYAVKVITAKNTERVAHAACRLAQSRPRRKVTCSAKYNVLRASDGFFRETVASVVAGYPDLEYEEFIVDDLARRLVASPHELDVVVLPNSYGDILSDAGAATVGGLGVVPSGCYGDEYAYFEPVHGTAPDIAGRGIVNPTATLLSAVMMLDHLGLPDDARRLEGAVDAALLAGDALTPDLGGTGTTETFAEAVARRVGENAP